MPVDLEFTSILYPTHNYRRRKCTDPDDNEGVDPESPLLAGFSPFERLEDGQLLAYPSMPTGAAVDTPINGLTQSASERGERDLKRDRLAIVISPFQVKCRLCNKRIKLSSKTAYDPFHWRNHRARCIKAQVKAMTRSKASTSKKHHSSRARLPSLVKDGPMHTPSLISSSDIENDRVSDHFAEEEHANSPTPSISESFAPSPTKQDLPFTYSPFDAMFEDYLRRSHPDYVQPAAASFQPAGQWRNWSWSQLKQPKYPVGDDDNYKNEDPLDPFELSSEISRWTAASYPLPKNVVTCK